MIQHAKDNLDGMSVTAIETYRNHIRYTNCILDIQDVPMTVPGCGHWLWGLYMRKFSPYEDGCMRTDV
jgi:hypothetical protein